MTGMEENHEIASRARFRAVDGRTLPGKFISIADSSSNIIQLLH
jgi:hypothetical protein